MLKKSRLIIVIFFLFVIIGKAQDSSIIVTSPQDGERWDTGTTHRISWSTSGQINYVDIFLLQEDSTGYVYSHYIADTVSNTGSYSWTIPKSFMESSSSRIEIRDHWNENVIGYSGYFVIEWNWWTKYGTAVIGIGMVVGLLSALIIGAMILNKRQSARQINYNRKLPKNLMICPYCKKTIEPGWRACPHCGRDI